MTDPNGDFITTIQGAALKIVIKGKLLKLSDEDNKTVFFCTDANIKIIKGRKNIHLGEVMVVDATTEELSPTFASLASIAGKGTKTSPVALMGNSSSDDEQSTASGGSLEGFMPPPPPAPKMPIRVNIGKEHATVGGVGGTATSQTNSATMDLTKKKLVTAKAGGVADVAAVTDNQGAGVRQSKRAAKPKKRDDK